MSAYKSNVYEVRHDLGDSASREMGSLRQMYDAKMAEVPAEVAAELPFRYVYKHRQALFLKL